MAVSRLCNNEFIDVRAPVIRYSAGVMCGCVEVRGGWWWFPIGESTRRNTPTGRSTVVDVEACGERKEFCWVGLCVESGGIEGMGICMFVCGGYGGGRRIEDEVDGISRRRYMMYVDVSLYLP